MKNNNFKFIYFTALSFIGVALLGSCSDPSYPTPSTGSSTATSNLIFVNAFSLTTDTTVDFRVDNVVVKSAMSSGDNSGVVSINVGPRFVDLYKTLGVITTTGGGFPWNTATSSNSSSLTAANSTLTGSALDAAIATQKANNPWLYAGGSFTVIAQGSTLGKSVRLVLIDNLSAPTGNNAKVRLINAVPTGVTNAMLATANNTFAPTATVTGTVTGWTNYLTATGLKAYNASASTVQSFASIDPTLSLQLYNAPTISNATVSGSNVSTTTAVAMGNPITTISSGGIYTIVVYKKNGVVTYSVIKHN
jgi:hypothetical protein